MRVAAWKLFKDTFAGWREDGVSQHAAALAYYTVFSLAPLLVIVVALAGLFFGQEAAQGKIVEQMGGLVGHDAASAIQDMIAAARKPASGILATVIGLAALVFGATGVFAQLQESLDAIWEVKPRPGLGVKGFIKARFLSFTMVLGIGFLLLVSLAVTAALSALGDWMGASLPIPEAAMQVLNFIVGLAVTTALFAAIYKVLPDVEIGWRDVWVGAAVTAVLFSLGRLAIGLYLGKSGVSSSYGAAGSFAVVLLWVYYSSQILFFGAEFTRVWAETYGSHILPDENAVAATPERAQGNS
jgi:membrane protein